MPKSVLILVSLLFGALRSIPSNYLNFKILFYSSISKPRSLNLNVIWAHPCMYKQLLVEGHVYQADNIFLEC